MERSIRGGLPQTGTGDTSRTDIQPKNIETSQQFFAWFGAIQTQMEEEQESAYRNYATTLNKYSDRCATLITEIDNAYDFFKVECCVYKN